MSRLTRLCSATFAVFQKTTIIRRIYPAFPILLLHFAVSPTLWAQSSDSTYEPSIIDLEEKSVSGLHSPSMGPPLGIQLSFGPHVGAGKGSEATDIRYASGFDLTLAKTFSIKDTLGIPMAMGPQLTLSNSILDTKSARGEEVYLGRYDQRTGAVGARFKWNESYGFWSTPFYGSLLGGLTFSKLSLNRTSPETFQKIDVHQINGRTIGAELGTGFLLTKNFEITTSWTSTLYRLDQSGARGTFEGEYLAGDSLGLLEGSYSAEEAKDFLAASPTLRVWAFKIGFTADL